MPQSVVIEAGFAEDVLLTWSVGRGEAGWQSSRSVARELCGCWLAVVLVGWLGCGCLAAESVGWLGCGWPAVELVGWLG